MYCLNLFQLKLYDELELDWRDDEGEVAHHSNKVGATAISAEVVILCTLLGNVVLVPQFNYTGQWKLIYFVLNLSSGLFLAEQEMFSGEG